MDLCSHVPSQPQYRSEDNQQNTDKTSEVCEFRKTIISNSVLVIFLFQSLRGLSEAIHLLTTQNKTQFEFIFTSRVRESVCACACM